MRIVGRGFYRRKSDHVVSRSGRKEQRTLTDAGLPAGAQIPRDYLSARHRTRRVNRPPVLYFALSSVMTSDGSILPPGGGGGGGGGTGSTPPMGGGTGFSNPRGGGGGIVLP